MATINGLTLLWHPITTNCVPDFAEGTISHLFELHNTPFEFNYPPPPDHIETRSSHQVRRRDFRA